LSSSLLRLFFDVVLGVFSAEFSPCPRENEKALEFLVVNLRTEKRICGRYWFEKKERLVLLAFYGLDLAFV